MLTIVSQVNARDEDDDNEVEALSPDSNRSEPIPSSPPPSFHSRSSSPSSRRLMHDDPLRSDVDHALEDAFDDGHDSDDGDEPDDRQRLMRGNPSAQDPTTPSSPSQDSDDNPEQRSVQRRVTLLPTFATMATTSRVVGAGSSNDGVFANLNAKPERGEKQEEDLPPVCMHEFTG